MRDFLKRLGIMLLAAIALAIPAAAQTESCAKNANTASPAELRDCIQLLSGRIELLESSERRLVASLENAWQIFGSDGMLVTEIPPLRDEERAGVFAADELIPVIWRWRRTLGEIAQFDPTTVVRALDRRFSADGGNGLRAYYQRRKGVIVTVVRGILLPQVDAQGPEKYRVLLEKPFNPLIGAAAYAWYSESCTPGNQCRSRVFADSFAELYGRPPTREDAYLLNSLYVRYQHGGDNGKAYVEAIREIGLSVLDATAVTKTGAGN